MCKWNSKDASLQILGGNYENYVINKLTHIMENKPLGSQM